MCCFTYSIQTPEACMAYVQGNGMSLKYVKEQTSDICIAAVQQNGLALQYVKEQTPDICLAAIRQNWHAFEYVKEQTPEICLAAVQQNYLAKKFIFIKQNRMIDKNKNTACPISYESFVDGQTYYVCSTCKYQYSSCIRNYFKIKSIPSCPLCASKWTDMTLYCNM